MVRGDVTTLAKAAGLHRLGRRIEHITVTLVWAPGDRRRRDEDNLYGLVKVAADALARGPRKDWVGLELVPDDTAEFMQKTCLIAPPPAKGMWLDLSIRFAEETP
jgi:crossover junction endodeoxyribonuclease RusA